MNERAMFKHFRREMITTRKLIKTQRKKTVLRMKAMVVLQSSITEKMIKQAVKGLQVLTPPTPEQSPDKRVRERSPCLEQEKSPCLEQEKSPERQIKERSPCLEQEKSPGKQTQERSPTPEKERSPDPIRELMPDEDLRPRSPSTEPPPSPDPSWSLALSLAVNLVLNLQHHHQQMA